MKAFVIDSHVRPLHLSPLWHSILLGFFEAGDAPARTRRPRHLPGYGACKIELACRSRTAYYPVVPDKEGTEFDSSTSTRRTSRHAAFFMFVLPTCAFNGGLGGGAARHAGYLVRRSVNPAQFRLPHLTVSGGLKPVQGGSHA